MINTILPKELVMLNLIPVRPEERELFWNINQKYLYEMTNFYPDDMDENGVLHYGYFDQYFVDEKRKAFFIYNNGKMIGFAMINPYSVLGGTPDYTMAEFTIFPFYRKNHFARDVAKLIFATYRGKWEIKFNEKNTAAKGLWTSVCAPYSPSVYHLNEVETVLAFEIN